MRADYLNEKDGWDVDEVSGVCAHVKFMLLKISVNTVCIAYDVRFWIACPHHNMWYRIRRRDTCNVHVTHVMRQFSIWSGLVAKLTVYAFACWYGLVIFIFIFIYFLRLPTGVNAAGSSGSACFAALAMASPQSHFTASVTTKGLRLYWSRYSGGQHMIRVSAGQFVMLHSTGS